YAASAGSDRQALFPAAQSGSGRALQGAFPQCEAVHHRPELRGLAAGAGGPLQGRRRVRPDLRERQALADGSATGSLETSMIGLAGKRRSPLPGFGLSFGITIFWLSLIVLIPLSTVFVRTAAGGWSEFVEAGFSTRALASYRLSFGSAALAAAINCVFGLL